jgi:hypothetical protein
MEAGLRSPSARDWTGFDGPGLAVDWITPWPASRPWVFFVRFFARASSARRGRKSPDRFAVRASITKCPGLDSNQHSLSATRPSSVRVYQFHHLGKCAALRGKGPQIYTRLPFVGIPLYLGSGRGLATLQQFGPLLAELPGPFIRSTSFL